jgi:hypothetical protein
MTNRSGLTVLFFAGLLARQAQATVLFQNGGTKAGWDSSVTQHIGTVTEVTAPTYDGGTALRMDQTFQGFDGYHSEVRKHDIEQPGQDLYYGEALQLPSNWIFHDQNVTFEQFAQTDVLGSPWVLLYVQRDHLFIAHVVNGSGNTDLGPITGLQGTWIRLVTRLKLGANGTMEFWVNGDKRATLNGNIQAPNKGAIRWSVGMYCTYWRREQPKGLDPMVLFHDQLRVATTMEEADPISWSGGAAIPPPDAGAIDASPVTEPDTATSKDIGSESGGDAAVEHRPDAGRDARDARDAGGEGGTGGDDATPAPPLPTPPVHSSGGCATGASPTAGWPTSLLVLIALGGRARRGLLLR